MQFMCLEAANEIQSPSLDLQWVSGCLSLESEPNHFPWVNELNNPAYKGSSSDLSANKLRGVGGCTELRGGGGDCWRETDLLLSCYPESSLSAWEPGREAGLISLWSERWEFFLVAGYIFPRWFELHLPHFI